MPIGLPPCLCPRSDVADDSQRIVNDTPEILHQWSIKCDACVEVFITLWFGV